MIDDLRALGLAAPNGSLRRTFSRERGKGAPMSWSCGYHLHHDPRPPQASPMIATLSGTVGDATASRLRRMIGRGDGIERTAAPAQKGLAGYGDAGHFARQLVADMHAFRDGRLPWRDIESRIVLDDRYDVGAHDLLQRLAAAAGLRLVEFDWPHPTLAMGNPWLPNASRSTLDGATAGSSTLLALHIPLASDGVASFRAQSEYWKPRLAEMRETVGCPTIVICRSSAEPCRMHDRSTDGIAHIGFPSAADLAETLSEALNGVLAPSIILRSIRHLEEVATTADMASLARRIRRRARFGDRPVRPEDVDAVSFEDVRPASMRLLCAVHASGVTSSLLSHGHIPDLVSIADIGMNRGTVCDPHMEVDQSLICMLAGCAAEDVLLRRSTVGFAERMRMAMLQAQSLAESVDTADEEDRGATTARHGASDAVAARVHYAYAEALSFVQEHATAIGRMTADLIDRITLRSEELAEFARFHSLISNQSASAL